MTDLPIDAAIGERVHTLMFRAKMSQTRLAPLLGITQSSLSKKLYGTTQWTAGDLVAAASALGVSVAYLVGEAGTPTPAGPTAPDQKVGGSSPSGRAELDRRHLRVVAA